MFQTIETTTKFILLYDNHTLCTVTFDYGQNTTEIKVLLGDINDVSDVFHVQQRIHDLISNIYMYAEMLTEGATFTGEPAELDKTRFVIHIQSWARIYNDEFEWALEDNA